MKKAGVVCIKSHHGRHQTEEQPQENRQSAQPGNIAHMEALGLCIAIAARMATHTANHQQRHQEGGHETQSGKKNHGETRAKAVGCLFKGRMSRQLAT